MKKIGIFSLLFSVGMVLALVFPWLSTHAMPTASQQSSTGSPVVSNPPVGSTSDPLKELLLSPRGVEVAPTILGKPNEATHARVDQAYGTLPLTFEANQGQTDGQVKFLSRGQSYTLFLTPTEAVFVFAKREVTAKRDKLRDRKPELREPEKITQTMLRMKLFGADPKPRIAGREELTGKVNYFIGNDPTKWRTNVPTYARVEYQDVYPGVNLVYYGNQRQLEYDFVVAPGADPRVIRIAFEGVDKRTLDAQGNLVLHTAGGQVVQQAPIVYQVMNGERREISGRYVLRGKDRVGFQVAAYDQTKPLVIDPVLIYSTFLGGSDDDLGRGIAVDASGNAHVTGTTVSTNFPTTPGAFQPTFSGGAGDAFVTKLNATGSAILYSSYLGGSDEETAKGIAVDAAGNAYVTGLTRSTDFPTTSGAFNTTFNGPGFDTYVTKFDPTGSVLVYSTFLGGSSTDDPESIAVDVSGNAYVAGSTSSTDFPTTPGAFATTLADFCGDVFVTKLNPAGSALVYSTFLGGSGAEGGTAIAVDAAGSAYVTGFTDSTDFPTTPGALDTTYNGGSVGSGCGGSGLDAFVTKLDPMGSALVYSTFLGGSDNDFAIGIAVDASGNAYLAGTTGSTDFPTTPGAFATTSAGMGDGFVTKLNPAGSALVYSTFLGGSSADESFGIAVDASGNAYVTGKTISTDFPTTPGAFQPAFAGASDAFVTKLNPAGSALIYSTFLGGSSVDESLGIAVDGPGNAYVTGQINSTDFPTTPGAFQPAFAGAFLDAFVTKISVNTPAGTNVSVSSGNGVTVTFSAVIAQGETNAATSSTGPTPPAGFSLGTPPIFYDVTTTATYVPPVSVCITYNPAQFGDPNSLRLFHFENSAWVDVTTSNDTINNIICGQVSSFSLFAIARPVGGQLSSLGPANIWVGLANSDDVGIRFDLRAEVYRNGAQLVGSGEVASVPGGSSGFNNARQNMIALTPVGGVTFQSGDTLSIKLFVRNACTGSGKNSGRARLWFNDSAANSRFDATIGNPKTYFLRDAFALATTPGPGPKKTIDVAAGAKCSPYKTFGTWSIANP